LPVCAAELATLCGKTWATAPLLNAVVLIGSMERGAVKSGSPVPSTTGRTTRRYSSIKPVSTSDRAADSREFEKTTRDTIHA
jgi:hypothetical protein